MSDSDRSLPRLRRRLRISDCAGVPSESSFYDSCWVNDATFWIPYVEKSVRATLAQFVFSLDPAASESKIQEPGIKQLSALHQLTSCKNDTLLVDTSKTAILRTLPNKQPVLRPDGSLFLRDEAQQAANLVTFLDLKVAKSNQRFTPTELGQMMGYSHSILMIEQPHRDEITSFILNPLVVQFVRARRNDGAPNGVEYFFSPPESIRRVSDKDPIPKGLLQLFAFFNGLPGVGFSKIDHPFDVSLGTFLGSGASSRVFSVYDKPQVVKIYSNLSSRTEDAVCEARNLRRVSDIPHVPRLIEEGEGALILEPRAHEIIPGSLQRKHVLQILDVLKQTHGLGLVHRDLRPSNLLLVIGQEDDILLNDWGAAATRDVPAPYSGTLWHASERVLKNLSQGEFEFAPNPSDDLESLVKTVFVLVFPRSAAPPAFPTPFEQSHAQTVLEWWQARALPPFWQQLLEDARASKYEELRIKFSQILP